MPDDLRRLGGTDFEWATSTSAKVRCTICGTTGWGPTGEQIRDGAKPNPWQEKHMNDHPFSCEPCGRRFASPQAIAAHRRHQHS